MHHGPEGRVYRFGPYRLDTARRRLFRGEEPVWLPGRQMGVLITLVARAGEIISNDDLTNAVWGDVSVTPNSVAKAVSQLRQALGLGDDETAFIKTLVRQGYQFDASVASATAPAPDTAALLEPYRAFVTGRAALETLDKDAVSLAHQAFADAVRLQPDFAAAHVGLANVRWLAFESTRMDVEPDRAALADAEEHARVACRLKPSFGDAWSTLAVTVCRRDPLEALAAARRAVELEPDEWRHYVRLAFVSWGAERLRAANHALSHCPGLALGHWFAATVYLARGAPDRAREHLRTGCASQDAPHTDAGRLPAIGLHFLHGLVLAARGSTDAARNEFARELAVASTGHVYARECTANTWYAIGALALRENRQDEAIAAFDRSLAAVPGHALAAVGLAFASRDEDPASGAEVGTTGPGTSRRWPLAASSASPVDAALVSGAALALRGQQADAARLCRDALVAAEPGPPGWMLTVDPLLNVTANPELWREALGVLRDRAV